MLAVEMLLNFVWELYRPRRRDQISRAYESRLSGLLTDPAGGYRLAATVPHPGTSSSPKS